MMFENGNIGVIVPYRLGNELYLPVRPSPKELLLGQFLRLSRDAVEERVAVIHT